jgi:predicted RNA-binding Zn ribbon-like protein
MTMQEVELVGGHPAVDLVNTVAWRGDARRRNDRLTSDADVVTWAARTGVLPAGTLHADAGSTAVLDVLVPFREALHAVLLDGGDPAARAAVHRAIAAAVARADTPEGPRWQWDIARPALADLPALAALRAAELLTSRDMGAIRVCADDTCGWLFVDRSRNRSRRWCSSADCGNRARARRHAQRVRAIR